MGIDFVKIPIEIYKLPVQGLYEVSILALIYNFNSKGFRLSNDKIAKALSGHKRTIERAISSLKKQGYIRNTGTGKNDRCLVLCTDKLTVSDTDKMSADIPTSRGVSTDILADHNKGTKREASSLAPAFVSFWNSKGNLLEIKSFTTQRQKQLQARMREPLFAENWQSIIDRLSNSSFCTGNNERGWKADIDWVLKNETNYAKVLEGKYDDKSENATDGGGIVQTSDCDPAEAEKLRIAMLKTEAACAN